MNDLMDDDDKMMSKKKSQSDSSTPVLDNFSRDLIKLAEQGKLDPVIGREKEIIRIAQILSRRKKNNPIIIGEPGCGKTAIIEGLAMKIFSGDCPKNLMDKRIVNLDINSVVAGTKYRGQFEERLKVIIEELGANPNIIVFIDEIHTIVGAGNASGSLDASNIFKPALARGEIQCIGATTLDEYRKNFEKDGALERRFQKVIVEGASMEETFQILLNSKDRYESFHKVSYSDEVLKACVKLAERYITDREFPDKAFDILDEVGARCQLDMKIPQVIEELKIKASEIKQLKIDVVTKKQMIDAINKTLQQKVVGQDEAVLKIVKSIRRNRLGIKDPNRPIGSFIFLGSTGVGKTHLAKQLAKEIFGTEDSLIRVDMSEYQEKHTISKLVGAPPGYVGYDEGGQLTEQVKNKPYSVILFDEVEKAHKDIFSILLQIMDDGHVTDSLGRKINFRNTMIIMTSNLGVKKLQDFGTGIGFGSSKYSNDEKKKEVLMKEMKNFFSPEFLNRIDDIITFNSLSNEDIKKIAEIEVKKLFSRLTDMNYKINYDQSVIDFISKVGYDDTYGARPLKRAIQDKIEDLISEEVLKGNIKENTNYKVIADGEEVKVKKGK